MTMTPKTEAYIVWPMKTSALITALLLATVLAGCTSATTAVETPAVASAPAEETSEPVQPTTSPEPDVDCITVAQSTIDALNTSLAAIQSGNGITAAYAVKASERENVYFVAADITGGGMEPGDATALWATNDDVTVDPHSGLVFSVNGGALAFSDWADGTTTDAAFSANEDGAQDALDCIPE